MSLAVNPAALSWSTTSVASVKLLTVQMIACAMIVSLLMF